MAEISNYKVAASPHSLDPSNTRRIMLDVLIALLPCLVCGVVFFGLYSLLLVVICVLACFLSEQIYNLIRKKPFTFDLSAFVTGLILGLNLPPRAPWYIPVIGGVFAIIVVKMLFGGLGKNFANPAATARVFLLLAYSTIMTQYIAPDVAGNILSADLVTAPTYLGGGTAALAEEFWGVQGYWGYVLQLLFGFVGGSIGETCKLAVLAGGAYLIARRVVDWRIPLVYLLTAAVMVLACYGSASEILLQLLSGGMLFGAVFMATDYATSPKWKYNRIIYAVGLGVLTVIIRRFGTYPEGTSLAILIMNLFVPIMDKYLLPVRFGQTTKAGKPYPQVVKWGTRGLCAALALSRGGTQAAGRNGTSRGLPLCAEHGGDFGRRVYIQCKGLRNDRGLRAEARIRGHDLVLRAGRSGRADPTEHDGVHRGAEFVPWQNVRGNSQYNRFVGNGRGNVGDLYEHRAEIDD